MNSQTLLSTALASALLALASAPLSAGDVNIYEVPQAAYYYAYSKGGQDDIGRRVRLSVAYVTPVSNEIMKKEGVKVEGMTANDKLFEAHTYIQNEYAGTALVIAKTKETQENLAKQYGTEKPEPGRPVRVKSLRGEFVSILHEKPVITVE